VITKNVSITIEHTQSALNFLGLLAIESVRFDIYLLCRTLFIYLLGLRALLNDIFPTAFIVVGGRVVVAVVVAVVVIVVISLQQRLLFGIMVL